MSVVVYILYELIEQQNIFGSKFPPRVKTGEIGCYVRVSPVSSSRFTWLRERLAAR